MMEKKFTTLKFTYNFFLKQVLILSFIIFSGALQKIEAQKIRTTACLVNGATDGINAPFDICFDKYVAYADIYLSSEICHGTISSMQWWVTNTAGSPNFPVKIYMKTTTANTFTATSTYSNMLSGATLVYSNASQSWLPFTSVPGYQTFNLSPSFVFNTDNLIIITEADWNSTPDCGQAPVFGYGSKTSCDQYWHGNSSGSLSASGGTIDDNRPGMKQSSIVILPVEMLSFTGKNYDNNVLLNWETATETNNDYFSVERSADGNNWTEIGKVKGAGNSTTENKYEFTDEDPYSTNASSNVYYRLRQTDFNGNYENYGPISIELSQLDEWKFVMKNIFNDGQLKGTLLSKENTDAIIEIVDLQGRIIHHEKLSAAKGANLLQINLEDILKGIYIIKIYNEKSFTQSKFVKL